MHPVKNSNTGRRWITKAPLLTEALLAVGGFKRRETLFSLKVGSLVSCPCSSGQPHTHVHTGSIDQTQKRRT